MMVPFSMAKPCSLLVCTDGSSASQGAIEAALALAQRRACRIRLLQVLEYNPGFASQAIDSIQEWEREAREGLQVILSRAEASGVETEILLRHGEAAHRAILAEAERARSDLIVMGRLGRTGLTDILMGSVTARIIGLSHVNVLVAPRMTPLTFHRLLIATDGSSYSEAAWREALSLAGAWSSQLLAVSVARKEGEFPEIKQILANLQGGRPGRDSPDCPDAPGLPRQGYYPDSPGPRGRPPHPGEPWPHGIEASPHGKRHRAGHRPRPLPGPGGETPGLTGE